MSVQKEFGDFQTPLLLAREVVRLIDALIGTPSRVIEPTAGLGTFLEAAQETWGSRATYGGYEINRAYVEEAKANLTTKGIQFTTQDFFDADWNAILSDSKNNNVLVLGNPPWVTNSALGSLGSNNIPTKTNFQGLRGLDAKTGKANFDIAEWMLIRLIDALPAGGSMAMLCKTMTARKVLRHLWKTDAGREYSCIFLIDAKKHFDVSVDACLLFVGGKLHPKRTATIYSALCKSEEHSEFGLVDGNLVSDVASYLELRDLDGGSPYTWRSGLKHDASEVMELTPKGDHYVNGHGESVQIEPDCVFPLLKSSDLGNGRLIPRKFVIVPQRTTGQDTETIRLSAPQTWDYLVRHADKLDGRKSSIYLKRPRFSIFGVGDYSFAPWKVAISGLYKNFRFVVVSPYDGRPVILDDTCYSIPCKSHVEASILADALNSEECQRFIRSLVFADSKRPITVEILRRISLVALARRRGRLEELAPFINECATPSGQKESQLQLVMDEPTEYRSKRVRAIRRLGKRLTKPDCESPNSTVKSVPISPPSGPATGCCNGLHRESNF